MAELSRRHLVVSGLAGAGASLLPGSINEANAATASDTIWHRRTAR